MQSLQAVQGGEMQRAHAVQRANEEGRKVPGILRPVFRG